MNYTIVPASWLFGILFITWIIVCGRCTSDSKTIPIQKSEAYLEGEAVAKIHCAACHQYTEPSLLDKASWTQVLNAMNHEMKQSNYKIPYQDWLTIQRFYRNESKTNISAGIIKKPPKTSQFSISAHNLFDPSTLGNISVLKTSKQSLIAGDVFGNFEIYKADSLVSKFQVKHCLPIDIIIDSDGSTYILDVGNLMPTNDERGRLLKIFGNKQESIIDYLVRPIHLSHADLNEDMNKEFIISSFGSTLEEINTGGIYVYSPAAQGTELVWKMELPGATKSIIQDFNKDGKMDILALFSQGRETILYFENQGNFEFIQKELIEHNPLYGTTDFLIHDFNDDGLMDIITSNGDNGDYSQIFKPYHGIRIYIQSALKKFEEKAFFPLHGASKMILHDFDQDQDQDLFVLSMYPNLFDMPWQSLLYYENVGNLKFKPSYIEESPSNQWILLTSYDMNADELSDIIVGSNRVIETNRSPSFDKAWNQQKLSLKRFENSSGN